MYHFSYGPSDFRVIIDNGTGIAVIYDSNIGQPNFLGNTPYANWAMMASSGDGYLVMSRTSADPAWNSSLAALWSGDEQGRTLAARAATNANPITTVTSLINNDIALATSNPQYSWLLNPNGRVDTEKLFLSLLNPSGPALDQNIYNQLLVYGTTAANRTDELYANGGLASLQQASMDQTFFNKWFPGDQFGTINAIRLAIQLLQPQTNPPATSSFIEGVDYVFVPPNLVANGPNIDQRISIWLNKGFGFYDAQLGIMYKDNSKAWVNGVYTPPQRPSANYITPIPNPSPNPTPTPTPNPNPTPVTPTTPPPSQIPPTVPTVPIGQPVTPCSDGIIIANNCVSYEIILVGGLLAAGAIYYLNKRQSPSVTQ